MEIHQYLPCMDKVFCQRGMGDKSPPPPQMTQEGDVALDFFLEMFFLVLKILITLGLILRHLEAKLSILRSRYGA
jgi:hypothetical protein